VVPEVHVARARLEASMLIPIQPASRRRRWSRWPGFAISLMVAFGLAGIYVNLPPPRSPGFNPSEDKEWRKCPKCGEPVQAKSDGRYVCANCGMKFKAAEAEDYS
jgi:hypothetical protein